MKSYIITHFLKKLEGASFQTKFGGQPDWLTSPEWPVSTAWGKRPMKFIGQIRLDEIYDDINEVVMAYFFMTQPIDKEDDFFDPDIIFPDGGENAVIVQPDGRIPNFIEVSDSAVGPTSDSEHIWIPQIQQKEEMITLEFDELDKDKFGGIPASFQVNEGMAADRLLVQLHTNWLPFYLNAGSSPTLFVFLKPHLKEGYLTIEDT
ncbi:DUF1963 domain-containing protein [Listeria costaricensis]|uniref:DUF1963 domain-containing protein n=1 Tax=Listeria costaricensis TaxID=2026604 RepID=UPI000C076A21|nr:DUF1963 domain-containing protein [Listeria costaricensis]